MIVRGSHLLAATPTDVFRSIRDPGVLLAVIPGCEAVEEIAPGEYVGSIRLRLPGIVGSYRTWVRLVDAVEPERAGLDGRVEGQLGSIVGHADFELAGMAGDPAAGTRLTYEGRAAIDGPLARLDSRFAEHLAASLIAQGLDALDRRLAPVTAVAGRSGDAPSRTEVSE
jgi:carbon monoxide dehydrogenase subunit G